MARRMRVWSGERGFTVMESVVTVVVLAILAAYASPKLFGLKDQADATEEIMKIQDLASRHAKEMLKAGKRGSNPILGDVVGFRPEVVAEPAPDTAPILVDFSYRAMAAHTNVIIGHGENTSIWNDPTPDGMTTCDDLQSGFTPAADWFQPNLASTTMYSLDDFRTRTTSPSSVQLDSSFYVPVCELETMAYTTFYPSTVSLAAGTWYWATAPDGNQWKVPNGSPITRESYMSISGHPGVAQMKILSPNVARLSCRHWTETHGAEYRTRGLTGTFSAQNGVESSSWSSSWMTYSLSSLDPSGSGAPYRQNATAVSLAGQTSGVCERQGPAPAVPPSDPGDPGAYPMASDHSGYCLSPGRKLPTYRDGAGTPTSSSSDPVMELGTEAVDDPTNCP